MKIRPWADWSLRTKLIAAGGLVQLLAVALLLAGSIGLLQRTLKAQAADQTRQVITLLDQAIAAPLAQRDFATLQQTLDLLRDDNTLRYMVLKDHRGQVVATAGWDAARPLPPRDDGTLNLDCPSGSMHLTASINLAGQLLGQLDFGLSTERLRQARSTFLLHSLGITVAALALSMALFTVTAFAITRRLARLARASRRVADGDFDAAVPVHTRDEIGLLGSSFNSMAATLKQRVAALQESERQQRLHLHTAQEEHARLTTLLGAMRSGILFVDGQQRVVYANAAFATLWSVREDLTGRPLDELLPRLLGQTAPDSHALLALMRTHTLDEHQAAGELRTRDGRLIAQRLQPVAVGDTASGCLWFHEDVTLERQVQQRAHEALHDPLTRLLNRRGLYEALQDMLVHADAASPAPLALMFIDLDDFKQVNDIGGHRAGDEVLRSVAAILSEHTGPHTRVARLGGDEFAVLCPGADAAQAGALADRLVAAVAGLGFSLSGRTLHVGCSIGIALYPAHARHSEDLVACADTAMYSAKQGGKNRWALFELEPPVARPAGQPAENPSSTLAALSPSSAAA